MGKARCSWFRLQLLATLMLLFMATAADAATVSGIVTNNSAVAGRVFLVGNWSGGGSAGWGKSVTVAANNTATYSIQGVPDGTYTVSAFLDTQNRGRQLANDPSGSSAQFTVSGGANATNVNLSLSAPTPVAVQPPLSVTVVPGDGGVLVMWEPYKDANGREIAPIYRVYWSTSANPGPLNMTNGGTSGDLVMQGDANVFFKGFPNTTTLYFSVAAKLNTSESTAVQGNAGAPVVIGPQTGGVTVSGTVTSSGATLGASTPLYIAITDSAGTPQFVGLVNSPSASQAYSIPGVLPGNRGIYAIVDINNNGIIDLGDLTNTESNGVPVTVASAPVTNANVSLVGADASITVNTEHWKQGATDGYKLNLNVAANRKRPVNATASGPNLTTFDMALSSWGPLEAWPALTARPTLTPADTYSFAIGYSDGTTTGTSPLTAPVTGVLDSFATATSPVGSIPFPFSSGNFTWSAPAAPPTPYTYSFWFSVPGFNDSGFTNMPSSTLNATYTAFTGYVDGTRYDWSIAVKDSLGNMARTQADFTPTTSPVITGFTPAIAGPGTAVTINGFNFDGATAANNSVTFPGSFTATPSSASANQLVVAVPSNAATSSGPISVTVGTKSGQSSGTFTIDATPPVTTASPMGGTQTGPINVTLTANEPATIYYTTNGVDPTYPVTGQTQTYSSPIPISSVTTALKYFARDSYGNKEAVQTQVYFYGTPTTLALAVDNSAITYGQTVTATATVSPAAATGTVTFFVDNVQYGAPVTLAAGTAQATISGLTATGSPHAIQALYGGDATYAGNGNSTSVTVAKAASTVTVNVGTYTYNASPQGPTTANVTGSSGAVTWSYAGVSGTTYGPSATLPVNAGRYTATATVAADANYSSASSSATSFTIAIANQTINVTSAAPASAAYNASFTVAATAPGGTVAYSSASPAVCTNVGATFTMVAPSGTCIVQYDQAGNANYSAALQVTSNTTATKANQTITFAALGTKNTVDVPFALTATASSNLPVSYTSSNPAVATVSGNTVTIVAAGTTTITASQAGDANWNAAPDVPQTLTITTGQTITVTTPAPATAPYNGTFTVAATSNSGLQVAYSSGSPSVCVNSGATFTMMTGTGTCIVQYDQAGDATYLAAPRVTSSTTAVKIDQAAVTVTTPAGASYGQAGLTASASGGSGTGAYSYSAGTSTACSVNATTGALTITSGTGTCSITATRQGDTNFNASAASAAGTVGISKAVATVNLSALNQTYTGSALAATATTTPAGLAVNITYGGSVTAPANAGTYAVVATINDTNYQGSASGNLVIAKASATVTISNLTQTADGTPRGVTITTTPANLAVNVTYNTSAAIPATAGTYAVVATINDPNYQGSATATLNVVAYGDIAGGTGGFDGQVNIMDAYNYLLISLKLVPPPAYTGNLLLAPIVAGKPTAVPGSRSVNVLDVRAMLEKVAGLW